MGWHQPQSPIMNFAGYDLTASSGYFYAHKEEFEQEYQELAS
jgi:hypothetical protein